MILGPVLIGSFQSVSDFVPHQKIIDGAAGTFPHRKSQHTSMNVETSGLHLLVLNHKVFGGKELSKLGLDYVIDGHKFVLDDLIIKRKVAFWATHVTLFELGESCFCLPQCLRFQFSFLFFFGVMIAIWNLHCSLVVQATLLSINLLNK